MVLDVGSAEARSRHKNHKRHAAGVGYTPPFAAMVVDANTGRVLYADHENDLRHPASVTKVMTLYMLFEQLEKGAVALDDEITISRHAASMAPSKLGLRPGASLSVEDAIKALVTKSANDVAAAVAESIGGTEERFAQMMTAKARSLGMSRTHYANASGLPNSSQVTTARDLITLGRAIQERFPRYYAYFSTHQFTFRGATMGNHNHLLGRVEGMDGIKTGYTNASGFNLLTSVKRGGRRIVSVVLGGRSAGSRDRIMADLIEEHLDSASPNKTTMVADASPAEAPAPKPVAKVEPRPTPAPVAYAPMAQPQVAAAAVVAMAEKPRPAVIANPARTPDDRTASIPYGKISDGSTRPVAASTTTTPASGGRPAAAKAQARAPEKQATVVAKAEPAPSKTKAEPSRPAAALSGSMIQIGASDEMGKANDLLAKAKGKTPALSGATSFTEKVKTGSGTLYRARFAGLTETKAEAACKSLKRAGFSCFTTKN
jgi:D-alanyl-D-alanine carboxypeptidase